MVGEGRGRGDVQMIFLRMKGFNHALYFVRCLFQCIHNYVNYNSMLVLFGTVVYNQCMY